MLVKTGRPLASGPRLAITAAIFAVVTLIGASWAIRGTVPAVPVHRNTDPTTEQLLLQASYDWNSRTPESLRRAARGFRAAVARDPGYAPGYAGLANTYLLLREYSTLPDPIAYARAEITARKAIALDASLPSAYRALGFVDFWWRHDNRAAGSDFRKSITLDGADAVTHLWYANVLAANFEFALAVSQIKEARRLDPTSSAILADYGLILYRAGHSAEGKRALAQVNSVSPGNISGHRYLAVVLLAEGNAPGFLREARTVALLRHDRAVFEILQRAAAGYRHGGKPGLFGVLVPEAERRAGRSLASLAGMEVAAGQKARALALLTDMASRGAGSLSGLGEEVLLKSLEGDPVFDRLVRSETEPRIG